MKLLKYLQGIIIRLLWDQFPIHIVNLIAGQLATPGLAIASWAWKARGPHAWNRSRVPTQVIRLEHPLTKSPPEPYKTNEKLTSETAPDVLGGWFSFALPMKLLSMGNEITYINPHGNDFIISRPGMKGFT